MTVVYIHTTSICSKILLCTIHRKIYLKRVFWWGYIPYLWYPSLIHITEFRFGKLRNLNMATALMRPPQNRHASVDHIFIYLLFMCRLA